MRLTQIGRRAYSLSRLMRGSMKYSGLPIIATTNEQSLKHCFNVISGRNVSMMLTEER